jgi:hypothetical protein
LSWEFLVHLKKASQIAIPLYYASQPVQQSVLLFFLNSIFSIMVLYTMPFSSNFLNVMEIMSSLDLVVTVIVGIFFTVEHRGQPVISDDAKKIGGFALVFLCAGTLLASILCIFNEVFFLAKFHRQPAVSAWLKFFSGNAGDSVKEKGLFNLFCTAIFNKRSSKAIIAFNTSIRNLKNQVSFFRLRSWYALLTYYPTSRMTLPFFRDPVIQMLKDLHILTRRIQELRGVGIHAPEKKLSPHMLETHGAGDPPHQAYKKIAEIDDVLTSSLSAESNRYLLAILVADKFRNKSREDVFTQRYWDRIVPASDSLLDAIARVSSTSERLCALFPVKQSRWGRFLERYWPDHSKVHSLISVIESFNQMSPKEHADFRKLSSDPFLPLELLFSIHSSDENSSRAESVGENCNQSEDRSSVGAAGDINADSDGHVDNDDDDHDDDDDNNNNAGIGGEGSHDDFSQDNDSNSIITFSSDDLGSKTDVGAQTQSSRDHRQHHSDAKSDDSNNEAPNMKFEGSWQQIHRIQLAPSVIPDIVARIRTSVSESFSIQSPPASLLQGSSRDTQISSITSASNSSAHHRPQSPSNYAASSALLLGTSSAANVFAPAPPPRAHKTVSDSVDKLVPLQRSSSPLLTAAISSSAAAKARTSDVHPDRFSQPKTAANAPATASPPGGKSVFLTPFSQLSKALNQPVERSNSPHQARATEKFASVRPRHFVLASATELQGAIAVDIPAGDVHQNAKPEVSSTSSSSAVPQFPTILSKLSATQKLKDMMSAKRKA